jgi:hypothetical protein
MPPLFVDGVEIQQVWVDGVRQDTVFADGVKVFAEFEDYRDDFLRDPNGTLVSNHQMNTGQFWDTDGIPAPPTIQPAINVGGNQSAQVRSNQAGDNDAQCFLYPITEVINHSFVLDVRFSWNPVFTNVFVQQNVVSLGSDPARTTSMTMGGATGFMNASMRIDEVEVFNQQFADLAQSSGRMKMYYDGTDIAGEFWAFPSGERIVVTRRPAPAPSITGRAYSNFILPSDGGIDVRVDIYDVTETGMPPEDIPWPT